MDTPCLTARRTGVIVEVVIITTTRNVVGLCQYSLTIHPMSYINMRSETDRKPAYSTALNQKYEKNKETIKSSRRRTGSNPVHERKSGRYQESMVEKVLSLK